MNHICDCEFPGTAACCRSPEQESLGLFKAEGVEIPMFVYNDEEIVPQCDLENPEMCEACQ